ncbi:hypothetical protein BJF92_13775 [Rhizobium rhizosphaerae]|uniref:Calcineurin-like phosphoesterase domain-containing protein n=1 Tax=Xaviernesmea rhizosphaerae TaxID=1672749 RepID=A0A1Q9AI29_9HYPH|nr:metallophosphoesterase [Xaviernesmea rhizosphaerae]OLP54871.1 hypothetical protein BJF92_13775 [Xaviernesmea rhizosphaerae]
MRAVVFSDLHLGFSFPDPVDLPDGTDVLIVAGDVSAPVGKSMAWLHKRFPGVPTIYVAGNHDYYSQIYSESMESGRRAAEEFPHIHFLENDEVVIDGVRFLGATLWTDYELYGDMKRAMDVAHHSMNDFVHIRDMNAVGHLQPWKPERTRSLHHESRAWLRGALCRTHDGPTVVVTHHCPHHLSVADKYRDDDLTPSFASDLDAEIQEFQPELWVHGHTHVGFDYVVPDTKTRVVCNPRGYVRDNFDRGRSVENPAFDMCKIVEI